MYYALILTCLWNPQLLHVHDGDVMICVLMVLGRTGWLRTSFQTAYVTDQQYFKKRKSELLFLFYVRYMHACVVAVVHGRNMCISYCHTLLQLAFDIHISPLFRLDFFFFF